MTICFGVGQRGHFSLKSAAAVSILFAGLAIGGCSADVTRFDSTAFNLNDPPDAQPIPSEPVRTSALNDNQVVGSHPSGPYGAGASSVQVAALSDPGYQNEPQSYAQPSYSAPVYSPPPAYTPPPPARSYQAKPFSHTRYEVPAGGRSVSRSPSPVTQGSQIEVQPGDTLYSLSQRYQVSLSELMSLNSLSNPSVHPGQKLYLPSDARAPSPSNIAAARAVESARPAPVPLSQPAPEVADRYGASYTVKPGDSLYGIARMHGVKVAELQQVNGLADPRHVKPGVVLKIPGNGSSERPRSVPVSAPSVADNAPPAVVPPLAATESGADIPNYGKSLTTRPTIINEHRVASLTDNSKANDASPAAPRAKPPVTEATQPAPPIPATEAKAEPKPAEQKVAMAGTAAASALAGAVKLRWPTTGRIVASFGGRPDGTHNDGINIAVPLGTDVHAAEAGVVAYAGNELKGYGNLVLLRHDNGWVTAYAHNDELLVKRGDKVKRGQVIAKAGKTGSVDRPQLHFELRQGSRPVDPIPYLEKL
jgi:murein DD-endopeptidase MepM/ murein hydrolase activator NlpD